MRPRIIWFLLIFFSLTACTPEKKEASNGGKEAKGDEAIRTLGKEGSAVLGGKAEVKKIVFEPPSIAKGAPYSIELGNPGSEVLNVKVKPLFFSKEGYEILGGPIAKELAIQPEGIETIKGVCPFRTAYSIKVKVELAE